jgi:hypothetical protein
MKWEGKTMRKIYRPTCENCSWRIKINQQMYNKFKPPATVTASEVRRSEWLGLVRMGGERAVQKLLEGKPGGRSKKKDLDLVGWMMSHWTGGEYGRKMNKSFGQNRMRIFCEGSQGQTSRAVVLHNISSSGGSSSSSSSSNNNNNNNIELGPLE